MVPSAFSAQPPPHFHAPLALFDRFNTTPWHLLCPCDAKPADLRQKSQENQVLNHARSAFLAACVPDSLSARIVLSRIHSPWLALLYRTISRMGGAFQTLSLYHSLLLQPSTLAPPSASSPSSCKLLSACFYPLAPSHNPGKALLLIAHSGGVEGREQGTQRKPDLPVKNVSFTFKAVFIDQIYS